VGNPNHFRACRLPAKISKIQFRPQGVRQRVTNQEFFLVFLSVVVLLPMVPAMVLFKVLPSTADASGPFQGLTIKLGGAFAGYFILLVLLLTVFRTPPAARGTQVWRVIGTVGFKGGRKDIPFENIRFSLFPPTQRVTTEGDFDIKVLATVADDGELEFPNLRLEAPGYLPVALSLEKERLDTVRQKIKIERKIELPPLPEKPYQPQKPLQADGAGQ
jgi:hypothetical protein